MPATFVCACGHNKDHQHRVTQAGCLLGGEPLIH